MGGDEFAAAAARLAGLAGVLLGWTPDAFWRATPAELRAALEALAGERARPIGRDEIAALMERFPD
ncbi:MAG: phage tail assembly chaperone [Alphaproteobacteria bacterium]|nr:phage tail assembly chaperone [Alphaproteobacteria bacterium]